MNAKRDQNRVATLLGVSSADEKTPVPIFADPVTNELLVKTTATIDTSALATSAKQDEQTTWLDAIYNMTEAELQATRSVLDSILTGQSGLATENTLSAVRTAVEIIDNAISGNEMQVDIVTMPTVTVNPHNVTNAGTFSVQVTSAPTTTVTATDLDIRNLTNTDVVTAELSATDNAVLDDIKLELQKLNSLVPAVYDYASLSYTGDNLTTVVFKTGGSGGTTVSTLTLAYTGDRLDSVTKT